MTGIFEYIRRPAVFEPEEIAIMVAAYERAIASLDFLPPKIVREGIAVRIIEQVRSGERDPLLICNSSLNALNLRDGRSPAKHRFS